MPTISWATKRQLSFLMACAILFETHWEAKTLTSDFWPLVYSQFFAIWKGPEDEIEDVEDPAPVEETKPNGDKKRKRRSRAKMRERPVWESVVAWMKMQKQQINNWFYNARNKTPSLNLAGTTTMVGGSKRCLTKAQMFSKLFCAEKIKQRLDEDLGDQEVDQKLLISLRAKYAATIYNSESEEVKELVCAELEKVDQKRQEAQEALKKMSEVTTEDKLKPEDYLKGVKNAAPLIKCFFYMLCQKTG
ncbi:hypothetical protein EST38_g12384 [Candolleomyces aberdarensis]|uniref:Uncharacterized protein n=1 Tax=Candolleomyces aberdarensis TaxID=2316362 RepID=A0A4Q2D2K3_9AGAR|nr:hypothetical protein EST38_g12384 [Candolleomyces aberdarensis]